MGISKLFQIMPQNTFESVAIQISHELVSTSASSDTKPRTYEEVMAYFPILDEFDKSLSEKDLSKNGIHIEDQQLDDLFEIIFKEKKYIVRISKESRDRSILMFKEMKSSWSRSKRSKFIFKIAQLCFAIRDLRLLDESIGMNDLNHSKGSTDRDAG